MRERHWDRPVATRRTDGHLSMTVRGGMHVIIAAAARTLRRDS
jgi:hypothetical protein